MRINNNISAMNTSRQLGNVSGRLSRSMEKLSSGLRIARAADDAAGLAVSEKLRGQIRGVNAAVRAQQDSVSGLQVAEGALNEVSSMFTRVKELGIQRSGTSDTDAISAIDSELKQILLEVENIETNTEYNGNALFDGTGSFSIYTDINGSTSTLSIDQLDLVYVGVDHATAAAATDDTYMFSIDSNWAGTADATNMGSELFVHETDDLLNLEYTDYVDASGADAAGGTAGEDDIFGALVAGNGATSSDNNMFLRDIGANAIEGVTADTLEDDTLMSQNQFSTNIVKGATAAINKVATIRGQIGSYQNRFEASIRNFEGTAENLQAAESRIRDVDMAKEMVGFTKDTIIQQAAQAMLVQANQLPQNIVGLLR